MSSRNTNCLYRRKVLVERIGIGTCALNVRSAGFYLILVAGGFNQSMQQLCFQVMEHVPQVILPKANNRASQLYGMNTKPAQV